MSTGKEFKEFSLPIIAGTSYPSTSKDRFSDFGKTGIFNQPIVPSSILRRKVSFQVDDVGSKDPKEILDKIIKEKTEESKKYFELISKIDKNEEKLKNYPKLKDIITPLELLKLVEDEKEEILNIKKLNPPNLINETYQLKKRLQILRLNPEYITKLEKSIINPKITPDDIKIEITPEQIAEMMNFIEKKNLLIEQSTQKIFNNLFNNNKGNYPNMLVSSVSPGPLKDIIVPVDMKEMIHKSVLNQKLEDVSFSLHHSLVIPEHDRFCKKKPGKCRKRRRKKGLSRLLTEEDPPWTNEDLYDAIRVIGSRPKNSLVTVDISNASKVGELNEHLHKGIEYFLDVNTEKYSSKVQLRGSQPPSWFPGYMVALSDISGNCVKLAKSPSEVLFSAWKSVKPNIFSDDSIVYN